MSNTIYDIDYSKLAVKMLPPDKRFTNTIAFLKALLTPVQWKRDLILGTYRSGSTSSIWLNSTTYNKYDQVIYNRAVYSSLQAGNINNLPTNTAYWEQIQTVYIGIQERLQYTPTKLTLEYALNKWFQTTFRQPPLQSDIYFTVNPILLNVFVVGGTESISSNIYNGNSTQFIINGYSFSAFYNLVINVPTALISSLAPTTAQAQAIIGSVVNRFIAAGINYTITPY